MSRLTSAALVVLLASIAACGSDSTAPRESMTATQAASQLEAAYTPGAPGEDGAYFGLLALYGGSTVQNFAATIQGNRRTFHAVSLMLALPATAEEPADSLAILVAWRGESAEEGLIAIYTPDAIASSSSSLRDHATALAAVSAGRISVSRIQALAQAIGPRESSASEIAAQTTSSLGPVVALYWVGDLYFVSDELMHTGSASMVNGPQSCPSRSTIGSQAMQLEFADWVAVLGTCTRATLTASLTAIMAGVAPGDSRSIVFAGQQSLGARVALHEQAF